MEKQKCEHVQRQGASRTSTSFNYINSILGSGIIGMPYVFMRSGLGLGMVLFIFVSYISSHTLKLMISNLELSGTSTYQGVMKACFGTPGFIIITCVQFLFPYLAVVGYNVGVGDTLSKVFGALLGEDPQKSQLLLLDRNIITFFTCIFITIPLSLYRNIDHLAKISFLSIVSLSVIIICVFVRLFTLQETLSSSDRSITYFNWSGLPKAVSIIVFSYTCHQNSTLLYMSMKDRTQESWFKVTNTAISIVFLAVVSLGTAGYFTFLDDTQGDLFENYCYDDNLINVSRLLFAVTLLFTGPIEIVVARDVITNIFWTDGTVPSLLHHSIMTVSLVLVTFFLSTITDCLGTVMEILGLYTGMPLALIFPALCNIVLRNSSKLSCSYISSLCSIFTGCIVILIGTIQVVLEGMSSCNHGVSPPYCNPLNELNDYGENIK